MSKGNCKRCGIYTASYRCGDKSCPQAPRDDLQPVADDGCPQPATDDDLSTLGFADLRRRCRTLKDDNKRLRATVADLKQQNHNLERRLDEVCDYRKEDRARAWNAEKERARAKDQVDVLFMTLRKLVEPGDDE